MSEELTPELAPDYSARQKRVQRLKRLIIIALITFLVIPLVGLAFLYARVRELNEQVNKLSDNLAMLEWSRRFEESMIAWDALEDTTDQDTDSEAVDQDAYAHRVYLTFDDGPSVYTDEILDILAQYNVKATFFVVGKEDEKSVAAMQRIVAEGHTLGMHSYSHKYSELYASTENFAQDFEQMRTLVEGVTGQPCKFYRFPGGSSNTVSKVDMNLLVEYLDEQGVVYYDWNISSGDAERYMPSVNTLVRNSTEDVARRKDSVVLLHDSQDKHATVEALPQIIETIQAMENTAILPITEDTDPVQHVH